MILSNETFEVELVKDKDNTYKIWSKNKFSGVEQYIQFENKQHLDILWSLIKNIDKGMK